MARIAAIALAIFTIVTGFTFHTNFADMNQMIHFMKNIMITGGLLQIVGFGAGALSFDDRSGRNGGDISDVRLTR